MHTTQGSLDLRSLLTTDRNELGRVKAWVGRGWGWGWGGGGGQGSTKHNIFSSKFLSNVYMMLTLTALQALSL